MSNTLNKIWQYRALRKSDKQIHSGTILMPDLDGNEIECAKRINVLRYKLQVRGYRFIDARELTKAEYKIAALNNRKKAITKPLPGIDLTQRASISIQLLVLLMILAILLMISLLFWV